MDVELIEKVERKLKDYTHEELRVEIYRLSHELKAVKQEKLLWKQQIKELTIVNHRLDREIKKYKKREGERLAFGLLKFGAEDERI